MAQNKIGEGGRNNALFHYGVYAKQNGQRIGRSKVTVVNVDSNGATTIRYRSKYNYKSNTTKKIGVTNVMTN